MNNYRRHFPGEPAYSYHISTGAWEERVCAREGCDVVFAVKPKSRIKTCSYECSINRKFKRLNEESRNRRIRDTETRFNVFLKLLPATGTEIAAKLGITPQAAFATLKKMMKNNKVIRKQEKTGKQNGKCFVYYKVS